MTPAQMWIAGLAASQKSLLHLNTQFNRDIPWKEIDMNFMNTNQSAHGDREYGFIGTRMNISRKVVVGHWSNKDVTDGDKVEAQIKFDWTVDYYGIGDLVEEMTKVLEEAIGDLYREYDK